MHPSMRASEIELRVIQLLDRVREGHPIESSIVELKADWIEPGKAARLLAGMANAAHGAPILWIVGVDEKAREVTGASEKELSNWWPQVSSHFDELSPELVHNLSVPYQGRVVVALVFDTDRRPFMVKKSGEREVPWRVGNRTRSAHREDLVRMLVPALRIPTIEVLSSSLYLTGGKCPDGTLIYWGELKVNLYANEPPPAPVVIPFHRCEGRVAIEGWLSDKKASVVSLAPPRVLAREESGPDGRTTHHYRADSYTIEGTRAELIIKGPGRFELSAIVDDVGAPRGEVGNASARLCLRPSVAGQEVTLETAMRLRRGTATLFHWKSGDDPESLDLSK